MSISSGSDDLTRLTVVTAAAAQGKDRKRLSILIHTNTPWSKVKSLLALAAGLTNDLTEKLKVELHQYQRSLRTSIENTHSHPTNKNKNKKQINEKHTVISLDQENAETLQDLKIDDGTEIVLANWSKIGSGRKWELAALFQTCFNRERNTTTEFVQFCRNFDCLSNSVQERTFRMSSSVISAFKGLAEKVGADIVEESVIFPQERRTRRLQLLAELFHEYSDTLSPMHSLKYEEIAHSAAIQVATAKHAEEKYAPSGHISKSAPVDISMIHPRRSNGNMRASWSAVEDEKYSSLHLHFDEIQFDMDADGPVDEMSRDTNSNRRKDKRKRKREKSRILAQIALQSSWCDQDYIEQELRYEDLVELENVPVGVKTGFLHSLPVQVLHNADVDRMNKNDCGSCRICLGEFSEGDEIMRLPCLHAYHKLCISKWLQNNNRCPQDMIPVESHDGMI